MEAAVRVVRKRAFEVRKPRINTVCEVQNVEAMYSSERNECSNSECVIKQRS